MNGNRILTNAVGFFSKLKLRYLETGDCDEQHLGEADSAALRVAMMVSALDGNVTADEIKAFEDLARKCRGYNAKSAKAVFSEGLRTAGYLELQAKCMKEDELVKAFVDEAEKALSGTYIFALSQDIRRAFVMWLAMAMSDRDFSAIERKCIEALRRRFEKLMQKVATAARAAEAVNAPLYAKAFVYSSPDFVTPVAPSANFLERAEKALAGLRSEKTAAESLETLKRLIARG